MPVRMRLPSSRNCFAASLPGSCLSEKITPCWICVAPSVWSFLAAHPPAARPAPATAAILLFLITFRRFIVCKVWLPAPKIQKLSPHLVRQPDLCQGTGFHSRCEYLPVGTENPFFNILPALPTFA